MTKYLKDICKECSISQINNFDGLSIGQLENILQNIKREYGNVIIKHEENNCSTDNIVLDFGDRQK